MRRAWGIAVMFMALAAFARPQPHAWVKVRSPHFTVYSDGGAGAARAIAGQMERMRQLFQQLFPTLTWRQLGGALSASGRTLPGIEARTPSDQRERPGQKVASHLETAQPLEIIAVRNWKELQTLEPAEFLQGNRQDSGIYQGTEFLDFILLRLNALNRPDGYAVIYHEYTHYIFDRLPFPMPVWLNEGLAEFYETARIEDASADLGRSGLQNVQLMRWSRLMPLRQLFTVGLDSPYYYDQDKASIFYAESWAVVHYLMLYDFSHHTHLLNDYLTRVKDGENSVAAAQASFGNLESLQNAVVASTRQLNLRYVHVKLHVQVQQRAFGVTPVTPVEAEALQAGVLAHGRRYAAADALAQDVLRRDPSNASAEQVRGLVTFRRHDDAAAQAWLWRAVKADPGDALAAVLLAESVLRQQGENPSTATATSLLLPLQNATKLRPDFAPGFDLLAKVEARLPHLLPAAAAAEERAIALNPGEWIYRWNAATLQFNAGNLIEAIRLLHAAAQRADSPARVAQCREAILQAQGELELRAQEVQQQRTAAAALPLPPPLKAVPPPPPPPPPEVIRGRVETEACPSGTIASLWLDVLSHGARLHLTAGQRFSWHAMVMPGQGFDPCRDLTGRRVVIHAQGGEMNALQVLGTPSGN